MYTYGMALIVVSIIFYRAILPFSFIFVGVLSIVGFFYYANVLSKRWCFISNKVFEHHLWRNGLIIRIVYVIASYIFYQAMTGMPFEFGSADAYIYHRCAEGMANMMKNDNWNIPTILDTTMGKHVGLDDSGYPTYLSIIYLITGDSIIIARFIKAVLSTYTVVLMYRLSRSHFGESVGRMTGICCLLMPNLIYYCGLQLKETEMLFLITFFLQKGDELLSARNFKLQNVMPVAVAALVLFTFRTVAGAVAILSMLVALVLTSSRVVKWGRRLVMIILAGAFLGLMVGNQIKEEVQELANTDVRGQQQQNMEWRSKRANGNSFAKYAGAAVFAPMIFTIPFPTMVNTPDQQNLQMIHGGNFVKNILSGFTILALFMLVISGDWRNHVFPGAFLIGYIIILIFSNFAQSERFHFPILPLELMLAAYGISQCGNREKRWYTLWCIFIVVVCIGWSWIKLKGRGL